MATDTARLRRRFRILTALGLVAGVVALLGLAIGLLSLFPSAESRNPETVLVEEAVQGAEAVNLLEHNGRQVYLVRLPDRSLAALDPTVDARGSCAVQVRPTPARSSFSAPTTVFQATEYIFRDPCTGSAFDLAGVWLFGPARRNLVSFPVLEKDDGSLVLTLDQPICSQRRAGVERQPVSC